MKTFKNISEIDGQTCKILLYAGIGSDEGCIPAGYFVEMLDWAAMNYKKCKLYINSPGGEVFEGLAIFKAIQDSSLDIEIFIDGVAASMAFLIAECGRPVHMSKYARLMAHSIIGGCQGTIQEIQAYIDVANGLQADAIDIIATRTGMTKEEIAAKWFDGKDHWINAEEALALKLIDSIYDGVAVPIPESSDVTTLYNSFQNKLNPQPMKWVNFFKRFNLKDEATEQEAIEEVAKIENRATAAETENTTLKNEVASLKAKLQEKETAEATALEAEIETALTNAANDGKIKDDQKPAIKAMLKADKKAGMAYLNSIPKARSIRNEMKNGEGQQIEGREKWTFDDYSKKAPKDLQNMKENDFESYSVLFENRYGKKPKK